MPNPVPENKNAHLSFAQEYYVCHVLNLKSVSFLIVSWRAGKRQSMYVCRMEDLLRGSK